MSARLRLAGISLGLAAIVAVWVLARRAEDGATADTTAVRTDAQAPGGAAASRREDPQQHSAAVAQREAVAATRPAPVVTTMPTAAPRMTPAQAREAMQALRRNGDCTRARAALDGNDEHLERIFWQWLPPEQAAGERLGRQAAAGRLQQGCAPAAVATGEESRQRAAEVRAAATLAGDTEARLEAWDQARQQELAAGPVSEERLQQLRSLLNETLLSGDLELLADLQHYERGLFMSVRGDPAAWALSMAWPLVACDLGLDCGPTSRVLDRMCISRTSGACGATSLEGAYRYTLHPAVFERIEARRAELLARIRSGQYTGIFDPAPTPPGGP